MKTLKYKVVEISGSGEIISFDRSVFDTKEEAIDFILADAYKIIEVNQSSSADKVNHVLIDTLFRVYQMGVETERWISVEDELPEDGQIVLCFGIGKIASMSMYGDGIFVRYIDHIPSDRNITIYYDKVSHWQPLPKPPIK